MLIVRGGRATQPMEDVTVLRAASTTVVDVLPKALTAVML